MDKIITMDQIQVGEKGKVAGIVNGSRIRRKLMDMGIVKGTEFTMEGKAPMGDPIKVFVRGYSLTLRKGECRDILVEQI